MYWGISLVSQFGPIRPILILLSDFCEYAEIFLVIQWILKRNLYEIYILQLSCIKTLACKHKSIVCAFLKN
jgi:hypothetical protein